MQTFGKKEVTLEEILDAREKRAALQEKMRLDYGTGIVSIGINMPGNIKYNEDIVSLLYSTLDRLRSNLIEGKFSIAAEYIYHAAAGPGAVLAVKGEAATIKRLAVKLEESTAFSRLLDIDVFDAGGHQLSRKSLGLTMRRCLLCDEEAVHCMRNKTHTCSEVIDAAQKLLVYYKIHGWEDQSKLVETIGTAALEAMLMELSCTPAPGLVDRFNAGAHKDMDFFTFIKSSSVLSVAMQKCALAGWEHKEKSESLLPHLREIGQKAEAEMFKATGGINTQKGILFLMGIMSAAAAIAAHRKTGCITAQQIIEEAAAICRGIVTRELISIAARLPSRKLTAGERFYIEHGITGIRGEIEAGLPSVRDVGLPCFKEALSYGLSLNNALVHALLGLMSVSEDTTILNRHGIEMLWKVQRQAKAIMEEGGMMANKGHERVTELDRQFIAGNISPGGSADLLAVTYFLYIMEKRL